MPRIAASCPHDHALSICAFAVVGPPADVGWDVKLCCAGVSGEAPWLEGPLSYDCWKEDWEPEADSAMHRCRAVLSNGRRCANTALSGSLFCGIPSHQAQAAEFEGLVEGS